MKAARLTAYGDGDQFNYDEVDEPVPSSDEVLVKVEASSLNNFEYRIGLGDFQQTFPLTLPAVLGLDLAGTVAKAGEKAAGFKEGDRVIGFLNVEGKGANAEYVLAKPEQLAKLPDNIDFAAGSTLPVVGMTGRQAVDALEPDKGDRVLVTGAFGAVGRAAVQYLKQLGAVPIAGVRKSRLAEAQSLGLEAIALEESSGAGSFDSAIDTVGGETAATAIGLVKEGGKYATVAQLPDDVAADTRRTIVNVPVAGNPRMLQEIADAAGDGELTIPIAETYRLTEVGKGHLRFAAGQVGGKIVFVP